MNPGQSTFGKTRADTVNTVNEMVQAYRGTRARVPTGKGTDPDGILPALTIQAYRDPDDGADLGFRCPVKLRWVDGENPGPQDPTLSPDSYQFNQLAFALTPEAGDEAEAIGITKRAIPADSFGPVFVVGVVLCTVNITDAGHGFATLTNSATALLSGDTGPARILWKETEDTGVQTCKVLLNAGSGTITLEGNGVIVRATEDGNPATCFVQGPGLTDTGDPIEVNIFPSPPREDFVEDGYYLAAFDGEDWYAETGPRSKCIEIPDFSETASIDCDTGEIIWGGFINIRVFDTAECPSPPPPPPP